jgi:hypothetical protein
MKMRLLYLISVVGTLMAFASTTSAQLADAISSIDGATFADDTQFRYFNRRHCGLSGTGGTGGTGGVGGQGGAAGVGGQGGAAGAGGVSGLSATVLKAPQDVSFEIRLDQTVALSGGVFLWVGSAGAQCETLEERNETQGQCAEVPGGNPRPVGSNFLITDLVLQDLLDASAGGTDIVTCDSSGLQGTEYQIFVFRDAPSGTVGMDSYGVATFWVDVDAPAAPVVDTSPQRQTSFGISWAEPDPPDLIQFWNFYSSPNNDASTAQPLGITAELSARSATISAQDMNLAEGDTAYIFMNAFDQAFVSDASDANEGELSEGVMVTNVTVVGYCDASGDCGGCSASPMTLVGEGSSSTPWILGLLFAGLLGWRLRR